jgi:hypothetical protein
MNRQQLPALLLLLIATSAWSAPPLFESDETLAITVEAPMRLLIRERRNKDDYAATVTYTDAAGREITVRAEISARGNHRLATCRFPPLSLWFERDAAAGTLFENQRRLKMVTPCGSGAEKEGWLLQELGIYRAYNEVTDLSFRVRRLAVTYRDTESSRWKREHPGFFIESIDAAAERLGRQRIRPPVVRNDQFDIPAATNTLLFQYLIANTDFAVKKGPSGEGCCHNGRVLSPPGREHEWVVLPYDFDQAGIINTDYALPDRRLRIKDVTRRLYRGFCWHNSALPAAIAHFNAKRAEITAELAPPELSSSKKKRIERFTDGFYEIINDPEELQEQIIDQCRGPSSFEITVSTPEGE